MNASNVFPTYYDDELVTVFENGKIVKEYTFDEVRSNAEKSFKEVTK